MTASRYSVAKALCNLASLGWKLDEAREGALQWARDQQEIGLTSLGLRDAFKPIATDTAIDSGRLYLTGRYGCYPKVFKVLARHSRGKTIYCPAANLGDRLTTLAQRMARVVGVRAEFLPISMPGLHMLKEKIAAGHNVLLFADVPFRSGVLTREVPVETRIGVFRATAAITRLPRMIDPDFRGVYCERRAGRDTICGMGQGDFAQVMRGFAEQLHTRPTHYEALPDLHRNWTLPDRPDIAVLFDHEGTRMLLHAREMRAWKMAGEEPVPAHAERLGQDQSRSALAERLGVAIDAVLHV